MIELLRRKELHRFLGVGAANTALCYTVYVLALQVVPRTPAYTACFLCGIVFTTCANVKVAFVRRLTVEAAATYATYYAAYWAASLCLLEIVVRVLGVPDVLGPAVVVAVALPVHYLLSRAVLDRFEQGSGPEDATPSRELSTPAVRKRVWSR